MPSAIRSLSGRALRATLVGVFVASAAGAQPPSGVPDIPPPGPVSAADSLSQQVGVLRSGDLLRLTVYREKDLSGEYLIDSRGVVQIPGVGNVRVAGFDPTQVHDRLVAAMRERGFERPEIAVQPLVRVQVLGEIRNPALYPVEPGTRLLQLLTIAGGPSERADLRRTRVVREGRAFTVDLEAGLTGSAAGRVVLYSNDLVVVPRKRGFTRESLNVVITATSLVVSLVTLFATLGR